MAATEATVAQPAPGTRPTPETLKLGKVGQTGLFVGMIVLAIVNYARFPEILWGLWYTLTGQLDKIGELHGILNIIATVNTVLLLNIIVSLVVGSIGIMKVGEAKSFQIELIQKMLDKGPIILLATVAGEELFARVGPYWIGTYFLHSESWAWWLMVIFNLGWGLYHLMNYDDPAERQIIRVLPQILSGLFDAYIYLRFGAAVGIFAHLMFDVVLLSDQKEQLPLKMNRYLTAYYAAISAIMGLLLLATEIPISALTQWFNSYDFTRIEGFSFGGYLMAVLFLNSLANLAIYGLMFDDSHMEEWEYNPLVQVFNAALTVVILLGLNLLLMNVAHIVDIGNRLMLVALATVFVARTTSGSALARFMVIGVPLVFLVTVTMQVLGFWPAVLIAVLIEVTELIPDAYVYLVKRRVIDE